MYVLTIESRMKCTDLLQLFIKFKSIPLWWRHQP